MSRVVLDTSAILAGFFSEPGVEVVQERGADGLISNVSLCETLTRLQDRGIPLNDAEHFLASLNLTEVPFDHSQAVFAALLRHKTRSAGLSFADRACMACSFLQRVPVLTADQNWKEVDVGVEVILIR